MLLTALLSLQFVLIPELLQGTGNSVTYAPVAVQQADSVFTHIPVVRKLLSRMPAFSDQFVLSDASQQVSVWPRLPYFVLALVGLPVVDHLDALPIVSTVLLTPLNAAVLYMLIVRISCSRTTGVLGTTVVLGFREFFVLQPWHWVNVDKMRGIIATPIFSNAMVHPQISFLLLCSALIALHRLIRKPNRLVAVSNGLIYGLSFYTYVYLWTYLTGLYGCVSAYLLWRGNRKALGWLLQSVILGLLLSVIYWRDVVIFWEYPGFIDFQDRFSLGRHPELRERLVNLRPHLVTLLGLGLMVIRRYYGYTLLFMMTLTAELLWKVPIVIGHDYQSLHYAYHMYSFCAAVTFVIVAMKIIGRLRLLMRWQLRRPSSHWLIAFLLVFIGYRSVTYSVRNYPAYGVPSAIEDAYEYIQANANPGAVVLAADPEVNMRVRNVAPVYVYVPSGYGTFVTTTEILQRAAEMMHFFGIIPEEMLGYQQGDDSLRRPFARGLMIPESYLFNGSLKYPTFPARYQAVQDAYDSSDTGALTYPADIIWVGPYERDLGRASLDDQEGLELIYRNESVNLYQVTSRDALVW